MSKPVIAAIIVAAGRGQRAGEGIPKQYRPMPDGGRDTVLARSISIFAENPAITTLCVVIQKDDVSLYEESLYHCNKTDNISFVFGGIGRQESVLNGLTALADAPPHAVFIHDAARPFASTELIARCMNGLSDKDGVVPALPVTDTLKKADNGLIGETVPRDGLFRAQTPQLFLFDKLFEAHKAAPQGLTDDAAVAEQAGLQVQLVAGEAQNIKLTTEEDFTMNTPFLPRTGSGFDVHRFDKAGSAEEIMLCGVPVPHDRKIIGHSDADVGLHALTDAILGGLAEGDIGDHFPPSDAANKDRASSEFLTHALALATAKRARLTHIDLTLICEAPKIGPHRDAMRAGLSALTGLPLSAVSVKATTTEGLGFTGRGEGIAAQATATLLISGE
ncbi:MAG: bifunctional 2-C-methyl-D-erythritol 4-phosphate cytidylyltransferase/2-C-methyl-D-erythritol 2,4-cyclodiphosphate synthase [Alphaproteobacteria bacterium]|nr:bifunctional 2-C-methyl-D-erythritol 4-phosphate cytidylyltransferase/2-C-methyl-D-erythritol 2,4-cyclodiphosphate synthase [Alphaproteobacteria bacterium]